MFVDTFGFGAGNGSMRTSSFALAVLSNLGVIGTLLFSFFFIGLFFGGRADGEPDQLEHATRLAAKSACMAWLISATISSALTDLGMPFFAFAAIGCARADPVTSKNGPDARDLVESTNRTALAVESGQQLRWPY